MKQNSLKITILLTIIYIILVAILISCLTQHYSTASINRIYDNSYLISTFSINDILKKNIPTLYFLKDISYDKNNNVNQLVCKLVTLEYNDNFYGRRIYRRNYNNIKKGSYIGNTYIVKQGDTLFYIAWITGSNYLELAKRNKIIKPYNLNVGQLLTINNSTNNSKVITINRISKINTNYRINNIKTLSINKQNNNKISSKLIKPLMSSMLSVSTSYSSLNNSIDHINTSYKWYWPTKGNVVSFFSDIEGGNKGIDIAGLRGQLIFATAPGKVLYSGNSLRGYGNLIVIKHNNNYLSAYAHNDTILVHDQQEVKGGQKIATMGSTGTNSVKLHFEIRYKGKSVNPLYYISQK